MIFQMFNSTQRRLVASVAACMMLGPIPASAEGLAGVYRGFLAFDFKGEEIREAMMISFAADGTVIMGAEEGQDEPVDPATGLATKNDFEAINLGVWREVGSGALEFGSQQYRAGSGFCGAVAQHSEDTLPACSFILTARMQANATVRDTACDLGGIGGGLAVQSVNGQETASDPFGLGLTIDYCLTRMGVDDFLAAAPISQ